MTEITKRLFELKDEKYKAFQCKLMPTVDPNTVIGVRTPEIRKLSEKLHGTEEAKAFLEILPHEYYDENNLHASLLEKIRDFDECIAALDRFLPFVDNWATCDMMNPKVLKKQPEKLPAKIEQWLSSEQTYSVRYGIGTLMKYYLDENFEVKYPERIAQIRSEEYYINMMIAWYFATALSKQYEAILPFIKDKKLDTWTHNKAIQKAIESGRITNEQKAYLKTLKIR